MFLGFMSITHALIAAAGTSLILATADPMALGLAVLGSQLPDIDTTTPLVPHPPSSPTSPYPSPARRGNELSPLSGEI